MADKRSEKARHAVLNTNHFYFLALYPGPLLKKSAFHWVAFAYCGNSIFKSSSGRMESTGHSGMQAPQSMHVSGSM